LEFSSTLSHLTPTCSQRRRLLTPSPPPSFSRTHE
jgi:hypothetical protein